MDRYSEYGLRGETDELLRRAARDAFKRAGLGHERFMGAMACYRDHRRHLGGDPARLAESFQEFATLKGWATEQVHLIR
jgi:hypothetical protein